MPEVITQSLILMGVGMATVFSFLVLLIFVMMGLSKVSPKLSYMLPDPEPAKPKAPAPAKNTCAEIALAILAACKRAGK